MLPRFGLNRTKFVVAAPDPAVGAYSVPQTPYSVWGWGGDLSNCVPPSRNPGYAPDCVAYTVYQIFIKFNQTNLYR